MARQRSRNRALVITDEDRVTLDRFNFTRSYTTPQGAVGFARLVATTTTYANNQWTPAVVRVAVQRDADGWWPLADGSVVSDATGDDVEAAILLALGGGVASAEGAL